MQRRPEPEFMDDQAEAAAYAEADFADVNQAFADRLLALAGPMARARAADLGTGPGDIPVRVARARPGWHVTAVDAAPAMLDYARRAVGAHGLADRIALVCADAKDTRLPAAHFDVVFSNSILHHVTDTAALWAELRRIARPGALAFFRDLARPADESAARRIVRTYAGEGSELMQQEYYRSLLSSYTVEEVRRQLAAAGLGGLVVEMSSDRHLDAFGYLP